MTAAETPRRRFVPNALVRFAAYEAATDEALQVSVATRTLREEFCGEASIRGPAKAMRTPILAEVLGTRDVRAVSRARRAIVERGWLTQTDRPGRESLFEINYAGIGAERGRFCTLTDAQLDALELGGRGIQRTLATILDRTTVCGKAEARIRLDDFQQAGSTTERAALELERCGIIEIERDRWNGNLYRPTDGGEFDGGRPRLAVGRVLLFDRSTPVAKRSNGRGVKRSNTPVAEHSITPGVKRSNHNKSGSSTGLPTVQQQRTAPASPAAPPAVAAPASLGGEQQQRAPSEASPAVAGIVAKLTAAGFNDPPKATAFAVALLKCRDEAWLDGWLAYSLTAATSNRGGWLRRTVITPALDTDTWQPPPSQRTKEPGPRRYEDPRRGVCYGGTREEFEETKRQYGKGADIDVEPLSTTPHTPSQPSAATAKHLAQWRKVLELPADTPDAEVIAKAREFDASRKAGGDALTGIAQAVGHAVGGRTRAAPSRPAEDPAPPPKRAGLLLDGTQDPAELERRKAEVRKQARIAAARSSAGSDPGGTSSYQCGGSTDGAGWIAA